MLALLASVRVSRRRLAMFVTALSLTAARSPAAHAQVQILGIQSVDSYWDDDTQVYWGRAALTVRNNGSAVVNATGYTTDCGPFTGAGLSCSGWLDVFSLMPGQTYSAWVVAPMVWWGSDGDIKFVVHSYTAGQNVDSVRIHAISFSTFTATLDPFPAATYTPSMSPHTSSTSVGPNQHYSYTASLVNNGNTPTTYSVSATCAGTVGSCSLSNNTAVVPAGGTIYPMVLYSVGAAGMTGTIKIVATAPARASGLVERDSAQLNVSTIDVIPPTVTFSPAGDSLTTAHIVTVTALACDQDGIVQSPTAVVGANTTGFWINTPVTATSITATSASSCNTAKSAVYQVPLQPGSNSFSVSVSDGFHTGGTASWYTYDDTPDHTPSIVPLHPSFTMPASGFRIDTMMITNRGWHAATYSLEPSCILSTWMTCSAYPMDPITVAAGATVAVPVTYFPQSMTMGVSVSVTLKATYVGLLSTASAQSTFTGRIVPTAPPTIAIGPNGWTGSATSIYEVRIDWCDVDDPIVQHDVTWHGNLLPNTYVSASRPGCIDAGSSTYYNLPIDPWQQSLIATARDSTGHVTTATSVFVDTPPLTDYAPRVTPPPAWHRLAAQSTQTAADTFTVTNAGASVAGYALTPRCITARVANCAVSPASVSLAPGASATTVLTYNRVAGADHLDTVQVAATFTSPLGGVIADSATQTIDSPSVETAPILTAWRPVIPLQPTWWTGALFFLTNTGTGQETYSINFSSGSFFPVMNWSVGSVASPSRVTINPGQTAWINGNVQASPTPNVTGMVSLAVSYVTLDGVTLSAAASTQFMSAPFPTAQIALSASPKTTRSIAAGITLPLTFSVTNTGDSTAAVSYSIRCSGNAIVACGSPSIGSASIAASQSSVVSTSVMTSPTVGLTGTVSLIASSSVAADTATYTITTAALPAVQVKARSTIAGANISRDQCVTIAAGDDAAYECGDLRIVHPLPATTTLGKTRAPTLMYTSRHQSGISLFSADIIIQPGNDSLTALTGRVFITPSIGAAEQQYGSHAFAWSVGSGDGVPRRITVPADVHSLPTGAYHYAFVVDAQSATSVTQYRDTGTVAIVNRGASWFGAGWWLDGLEQLVPYSGTEKLWVAGDGTTRLYQRSLSDTTVWTVTPTLDRPDTVVVTGGFQYRHLRNGAYVKFDATGRHLATVNALGQVTTFNYNDGDSGHWARLVSIDLPRPIHSAATVRYVFSYGYAAGSDTYLSQVTSPVGPQGSRAVSVQYFTGTTRVAGFSGPAPDASSVGFTYNASGLLSTRTDRRGFVTSFDIEPASAALQRSVVQMAGTGSDIVKTFCAIEATGLLACANGPTDSSRVQTWYDGPRAIADTTRFYVNRYGAPVRIVDAIGRITTIARTDARWPLLPTSTIAANGFETRATYTERALTSTETAVKPFGGADATTSYFWNSNGVLNLLDSLVGPTGERTRLGYFANGDRQWQEDGRGSVSRAWFTYNGDRQIASVQAPGNSTNQLDRLDYDSTGLGTVRTSTNPLGIATTMHADAIGRVDSVYTPLGGGLTRIESDVFDVMDRSLVHRSSAPAAPYVIGNISGIAAAGTLTVTSMYDAEGNPLSVTRSAAPIAAGVGGPVTTWSYDGANRKTSMSVNFAPPTQWTYDEAGNAISTTTPRLKTSTTTYDALNRPTQRISDSVSYASQLGILPVVRAPVQFPYFARGFTYDWISGSGAVAPRLVVPGDTATFTYDFASGGLATANNASAHITRAYYPNGALQSDLTQLAVVDSLETPTLPRFGVHSYALSYTYDLSGRRLSRTDVLPGCVNCVQTYHYDAPSGFLDATYDRGASFTFAYDSVGRVNAQCALDASNISVSCDQNRFDAAGRLIGRTVTDRATTLYNDVLTYDDANRITAAEIGSGDGALVDHVRNAYSGLGSLAAMQRVKNAVTVSDEFATDALGNAMTHKSWNATDGSSATLDTLEYAGEQQIASRSGPRNWAPGMTVPSALMDTTTSGYDPSGNLTATQRLVSTFLPGPQAWIGTIKDREWTWNAYNADDKLSVSQRSYWPDSVTQHTVFVEHRYDALGRRVMTRTRWDQYCPPSTIDDGCQSSIARTVWDGDQVLMEMRNVVNNPVIEQHPDCLPDSDPQADVCRNHFPPRWSQDGAGAQLETEYSGGAFAGAVRYTHAMGIDDPVALWKSDLTAGIVPHRSWRGVFEAGSYIGTPNTGVNWPARNQDAFHASDSRLTPIQPTNWLGSVVDGRADPSGLVYMRNRFYDPKSGRFTQQDPIGLGGGMNLYGFAGGDPVNYSDPFGLWPSLGQVANFAAGFGDAVTFGLTDVVRDAINANGVIDHRSGSYFAGTLAGAVADATITAGLAGEAAAAEEEGIVYRRTNVKTGEEYIGRSKSEKAFLNRQNAHDSRLGVKHEYEVIGRGRNGTPLRAAEESAIRTHGGPGKLANKRYEMNDEAYRAAGGTVPKP
jgi:RHS repeat-associated protein